MHMLPGQSLMHDNKLVVNAIVCTTKTMYLCVIHLLPTAGNVKSILFAWFLHQ